MTLIILDKSAHVVEIALKSVSYLYWKIRSFLFKSHAFLAYKLFMTFLNFLFYFPRFYHHSIKYFIWPEYLTP